MRNAGTVPLRGIRSEGTRSGRVRSPVRKLWVDSGGLNGADSRRIGGAKRQHGATLECTERREMEQYMRDGTVRKRRGAETERGENGAEARSAGTGPLVPLTKIGVCMCVQLVEFIGRERMSKF